MSVTNNILNPVGEIMKFLPTRLLNRCNVSRLEGDKDMETFYCESLCLIGEGESHSLLVLTWESAMLKRRFEMMPLRFSHFREPSIVIPIQNRLRRWEERAQNHLGYKEWSQPKSFVGVLVRDKGIREVRQIPAANPFVLFHYHRLLVRLEAYIIHVKSSRHLADMHTDETALTTLYSRLCAFVAESTHHWCKATF